MMLDVILENLKTLGDKVSYVNFEGETSFSELYRYVANIYHFLLRENKKRLPVVIIGHKENYVRATMVASSFAGLPYVPVDSHTPSARIESIIKQLGDVFVIGDFDCSDISRDEIEMVSKSAAKGEIEQIFMEPDDTYYIIFTSGSTGEPKGVMVSYKNVDSCIRWLSGFLEMRGDVIANQGDFSFDLSVADLYVSLFCGMTHLAFQKDEERLLDGTIGRFIEYNVEIGVFTPSFCDLLLSDKRFSEGIIPSFRTFLFCGERLRAITVERLKKRFPSVAIINCYGPTEATFAVTAGLVDNSESISLGSAKDGVEIFIVDDEMNALSDGEVGEIVIVGDSVAKGYLSGGGGFFNHLGRNAYRTGDFGWKTGGEIFFAGRNDGQIKYKGYRIEVDDIEKNLLEIPFIEYAIVYTRNDADGRVLKLCADVKLQDGVEVTPKEISKLLEKKVANYMIPLISIVDEIPLTKNGKHRAKG